MSRDLSREEMVRFVLFILRLNEDDRQFGGLRKEAEMLVDEYLARERAA